MPTWAKVAIGCGCLTLLAGAALVALIGWGAKKGAEVVQQYAEDPAKAAEFIINLDPDLEVVATDEAAGTMTIRRLSTGEENTFDYSEIQEGRFSFEGADGEGQSFEIGGSEEGGLSIKTGDGEFQLGGGGNLDKVPSWVPLLADAESSEAVMTMRQAGKAWGTVSQSLAGDTAAAVAAVEELLRDRGFEPKTTEMSFGGDTTVQIEAAGGDGQKVTYVVRTDGGKTALLATYEGQE